MRSFCTWWYALGLKRLITEKCAYLVICGIKCVINVIVGLSLAMTRDGSSGGVIRLASISEAGVERHTLTGDDMPKFYEG